MALAVLGLVGTGTGTGLGWACAGPVLGLGLVEIALRSS